MCADIFLSYAQEDTSKALELARLLEADGWSVWWDREIKPGQDFEVEIDMALSSARAVVVLWSEFSVCSNWVRSEAREAKENNKLIPVQLDGSRIPLSYRALTTIDLKNWPDRPSLVELSMLKSTLSRVLLNGVSEQMLKKPTPDDMTLSVRVASRVAEMVGGQYARPADNDSDDCCLRVERCISDILLDLLLATPNAVVDKREAYAMKLGRELGADLVACTRVDFSRMRVTGMHRVDGEPLSSGQEKSLLTYVNDYCSPAGEYNLHIDPEQWHDGVPLCLPLAPITGGREYIWFSRETPGPAWDRELQESILKLAAGLRGHEPGSTQV